MNEHEIITQAGVSYDAVKKYSKTKVAVCNDCSLSQREFCFSFPETFCDELVNQYKFLNTCEKPTEEKK